MSIEQSGIKVIARNAMVGIAALNSRTGEDGGRMDGSAGRTIGTLARYDSETFISTRQLYNAGGRLLDELRALWRADAIHIEIDGRRITAITELTLSEPATYLRRQSAHVSPSNGFVGVAGTWTETYDAANHRTYQRRTAADATGTFLVELPPEILTRDAEGGFKLLSIELLLNITVAALDADLDIEAYLLDTPDNASQQAAGVALHTGGTYDAAHDDAGERLTTGFHTIEFTFDPGLAAIDWLQAGQRVFLEVSFDAAAGSVVDYYGTKVNYLTRPGIATDADDS